MIITFKNIKNFSEIIKKYIVCALQNIFIYEYMNNITYLYYLFKYNKKIIFDIKSKQHIVYSYHSDNYLKSIYYKKDNFYHNDKGPAIIEYNEKGEIINEIYYLYGISTFKNYKIQIDEY